ncbi:hypothetical protein E2C01_041421 [Portunus trituberculatus]|uniref:Uncharacterized protein n=1 Tax=Portunus trituberculatus TaxID=210409 RepID=A0A5B7FRV2_PORTR|nr:hypothetical protein [Portunus trituberculatus]
MKGNEVEEEKEEPDTTRRNRNHNSRSSRSSRILNSGLGQTVSRHTAPRNTKGGSLHAAHRIRAFTTSHAANTA